ncbi:MAG: P1 family peptidase [Candidatus Promineifilaceae bacterium]
MGRTRLRDLNIIIGTLSPGQENAITDVPGVLVGQKTLVYDEPRAARTGVTVIVPREGNIWRDHVYAGFHSFNGCGEMTGVQWLTESGLLCYPIALTCTHQVGTVDEAVLAYGRERNLTDISALPVVGETWDGWLNDADGFHIKRKHIYEALDSAVPGPVAEGNTGGGTGMICHGFKGGTGTASRVIETGSGTFTVGALVQANHGSRDDFRVDGVPVGRLLDRRRTPTPFDDFDSEPGTGGSSILTIIGTDAPLLPHQCTRLAKRATIGVARVGGIGHNGSGDLFLAFATGNHYPADVDNQLDVRTIPGHHMNPLFVATAEAVEEAILNAVTSAETTVGYLGRTALALPLDELQEIMDRNAPWRGEKNG